AGAAGAEDDEAYAERRGAAEGGVGVGGEARVIDVGAGDLETAGQEAVGGEEASGERGEARGGGREVGVGRLGDEEALDVGFEVIAGERGPGECVEGVGADAEFKGWRQDAVLGGGVAWRFRPTV